jgi:SulP family sulfate permease
MVKAGIKPENGNFTVYPILADALDAVLDQDPNQPPATKPAAEK